MQLLCHFVVIFGLAEILYDAIFETYFYLQDIWIAATAYYMYFYLTVLSALTARLQLRNFIVS